MNDHGPFRTASGKILTDEDFNRLALEEVNGRRLTAIKDYIGLDDVEELDGINEDEPLLARGPQQREDGTYDYASALRATEATEHDIEVPRYLLHQQGQYGNDWFTLFATPEAAGVYAADSEPGDWENTLVDLDEEAVFEEVHTIIFKRKENDS